MHIQGGHNDLIKCLPAGTCPFRGTFGRALMFLPYQFGPVLISWHSTDILFNLYIRPISTARIRLNKWCRIRHILICIHHQSEFVIRESRKYYWPRQGMDALFNYSITTKKQFIILSGLIIGYYFSNIAFIESIERRRVLNSSKNFIFF